MIPAGDHPAGRYVLDVEAGGESGVPLFTVPFEILR